MDYFISAWKNAFNYKGRARRAEFGWFILYSFLVYIALGTVEYIAVSLFTGLPIIDSRLYYTEWEGGASYHLPQGFINGLFSILGCVPTLAVTARRYHDLNKSGWWLITFVLPFIVAIILLLTSYFAPALNKIIAKPLSISVVIILLMNFYFIIKLFFQDGEPEENRFGKSPKYIVEETKGGEI